MEILGIFGVVFAATASGVLVYEHQTDVLRYVEGHEQSRLVDVILEPVRAAIDPLIERINWKARNAIYLASFA